jgi:GAF domain-containing protein
VTESINIHSQIIDQELLIHRITNRIRQSLELNSILTTTTAEISSFLTTDRVIIYVFHADGSGEVIAESIKDHRLPSLLGLNFPSDDIPPTAKEKILKTRQRSIVNVDKQLIGISILDSEDTGEPLADVSINYRFADQCHLQYLTAMGVQFSLSVPILTQEKLWGLLVAHHTEPKEINISELQLIQRVADQVSLAIAQSTLLNLAREQAEKEATINKISTLLHDQPGIELQTALVETVEVFKGSGGRLYILDQNNFHPGEIYIYGQQPELIHIEENISIAIETHPIWQKWIGKNLQKNITNGNHIEGSIWQITDLYQEENLKTLALAFAATEIRGMLVIGLYSHQKQLGYLTIFRNQIDVEKIWAGQFDSDQRQRQPRQSFAAWKELKQGQAQAWTAAEIDMAIALGNKFSMAIQQYKLYQEIQQVNARLERQFQSRTIELQKSLEKAKVIKEIIDQIRSTLNLDMILKTIVVEVRKLINTDRVLIYKVQNNLYREVVVEDVKENRISLAAAKLEDYFSAEYIPMYEWASFQAINDINQADLTPKHLQFLNSIEVKAKLVVPIRMGDKLWGLLIAHECNAPRGWENTEIELLEQLASEAAIAIQQAELYKKTVTAAAKAKAQAEQIFLAAEQQKTLFTVVNKIRESLDLPTIFTSTVKEVRKLLNADRVGVFKFLPHTNCGEGEFVAEDLLPELKSVLGIIVKDHCFAQEQKENYLGGKFWYVNDIYEAELSECHINFLEALQIRANLVIPLVESEELWGLLCIHQCKKPRQWTTEEIDFSTKIAAQLAVALQQAELLAKTQEQTTQISRTLEELKATQTQLIQTEKMSSLGQLVAGVAHEINNPVNFIYGNVNYVAEYAQDLLKVIDIYQKNHPNWIIENEEELEDIDLEFIKDDLPKMISSMRLGTERIRQLVLSLRNFSRLDQAERKPVNIHEGIDSTLLILQHRMKARDQKPSIKVIKNYGEIPPIECYAGQMNQVFMNVISNAIDALDTKAEELKQAEEKPVITIETKLLENNRVMISIADNAHGIPAHLINQIFNPFFTTKPVGKGTGLGLSISYQIVVEKHEGVFKCNSELGKGTEFYIEIPVTE